MFGCDRQLYHRKERPSPSIWEANFKEKKIINSSIIAKSSKIYQMAKFLCFPWGTISRGLRDVKNVTLIKVILTRNIEKENKF